MNFKQVSNYLIKRYSLCFLSRHYSSNNINKILIANRGEIACRIMKTARKMGIKTVAVYSDADSNSLHVALADEAYYIGQPQSQKSYLRADKIINIAKISRSDAIHPGYGFLSENYEFASLCSENNLIFIGPPASAIRDMGIKSTSKKIMTIAGVPVIPGYHGDNQSIDILKREAKRIGFPIMIKAVRGGGGKGMRIALNETDFLAQLESAKRESITSFGDDVMLLERFIEKPRHVEVQIFGDNQGNFVYLFERDCSVQRRHQKIIEEAPGPNISDAVRKGLGEAAVRAAKAVNYVGAGTVEFIFEPETLKYYFMEMNTRLQVEHPITEMITGVDLVEWQIKVARNEQIPLTQEQIKINGHSFEARIYAENPNEGFLPGAGHLKYLNSPNSNIDVRVETGVCQGDEVSIFYDPMIAKLVVWGENRKIALSKLKTNLTDYNIVGVDTNIEFLMALSQHKEFINGNIHTDFIEQYKSELLDNKKVDSDVILQVALGILLKEEREAALLPNSFYKSSNWRLNHDLKKTLDLKINNQTFKVMVISKSPANYEIMIDNMSKTISGCLEISGNIFNLNMILDNKQKKARIYFDRNELHLFTKNGSYKINFEDRFPDSKVSSSGERPIDSEPTSPMPGTINKIYVHPGDKVTKGDPLVVIIAMKMEHTIKANKDGVVEKVYFTEGQNIDKNAILIKLE